MSDGLLTEYMVLYHQQYCRSVVFPAAERAAAQRRALREADGGQPEPKDSKQRRVPVGLVGLVLRLGLARA